MHPGTLQGFAFEAGKPQASAPEPCQGSIATGCCTDAYNCNPLLFLHTRPRPRPAAYVREPSFRAQHPCCYHAALLVDPCCAVLFLVHVSSGGPACSSFEAAGSRRMPAKAAMQQ